MDRVNLFSAEAQYDDDDPEGAHKLTNKGEETVRLLMVSTRVEPAVAVYPDSNKIAVWPGTKDDQVIVRRESRVDYWDREL